MRIARLLASGFGVGFFPVAPGTAGSLVALCVGAVALAIWPAIWTLAVLALISAVVGWWAIGASGEAANDPGWVVIDEFAGQFLAMAPLARPSPAGLLLAFVLFRLFDIWKPGPIGWADRRKTAAGVMGDDVIAGGFAAILVWCATVVWPAWF